MRIDRKKIIQLWKAGCTFGHITKLTSATREEIMATLALAELRSRESGYIREHGMEWIPCKTCGIDFRRHKYRPSGNKECRECRRAGRESEASPERLQKWNLTREQYAHHFKQQGGVCAICKNPEPQFEKALAVDHDHKTGQIRSLLCSKCNMGLGHFQDSPELLQAAIQYLRFHRKDADYLVPTISEVAVTPLNESDLAS